MGRRKDPFPLYLIGIMLITTLVAISIIIHVNSDSPGNKTKNIVGLGTSTGLNAHFAPADDPFTEAPTPYLQAQSTTDETGSKVEITVSKESGVLKQFVYKKGYYSNGSAWKQFTFSEQPVSNSPWILGEASYVSGYEKFLINDQNYVVAFVCRKYSAEGNFVCGPHYPMNSNRKNWTITVFEAPEYIPPVYLCPNNEGRFCGALTSSVSGKNMSFAEVDTSACEEGMTCQICPGAQVCYQCEDYFTNVSGRCFSQDFTCPASPNQYCASESQANASTDFATGTCPGSAPTCYKCIENYKLQNGACIFDMSKVNCPTGKICLASMPEERGTRNNSFLCRPGEYCYQCNAGLTLVNGQCVSCTTNAQCNDNDACTTDTCNNPGTPTASCSNSQIAPICPGASTVTCDQQITPTNNCGTCAGTGTNCADTTKTCVTGVGCVRCSSNIQCNDNNACTTDVCNSAGTTSSSCSNTAIAPTCPDPSTVACGQTISPTNNCGTCTGKGTKCTTAAQVCNQNTWQCESSCNGCTVGTTCYTNGATHPTNSCQVCSGTSWTNKQDGASCGTNQMCSGGSCGTPTVCTNGQVQCVPGTSNPSSYYARIQTCTNGQWQTTQTCQGNSCSGNSCGPADCTPSTETCNQIDDDCDGQIDEGCDALCTYTGQDPAMLQRVTCPNPSCTNAPYKITYKDDWGDSDNYLSATCCTKSTDCSGQGGCFAEGKADLPQFLLCANNVVHDCYESSDQGKQYSTTDGHIWRCVNPGNSAAWVDMTSDSCMRASYTTPLSMSCSSCSGNPVSVQSMIGTTPYSLDTPQGKVYYSRCCPSSSYCSDAEQCYASGTPHPLFSEYSCDNGNWKTAPTCSAPKCQFEDSCYYEGSQVYKASSGTERICQNGNMVECGREIEDAVLTIENSRYVCRSFYVNYRTTWMWSSCGWQSEVACPTAVSGGIPCNHPTYAKCGSYCRTQSACNTEYAQTGHIPGYSCGGWGQWKCPSGTACSVGNADGCQDNMCWNTCSAG